MSLSIHARQSGSYLTANPSLASYMPSTLMNLEPRLNSTSNLSGQVM